MFWRQGDITGAKQGVGARGEYGNDSILSVDYKINLRANRPANPVFLHGLDHFRPVQVVSRL